MAGEITRKELSPEVNNELDNFMPLDASTSRQPREQIFTSSETWVKPANVDSAEVICVGGGGGRDAATKRILNATGNFSVTIGSGGSGGAFISSPLTANEGSDGGTTSFGGLVVDGEGGAGGFSTGPGRNAPSNGGGGGGSGGGSGVSHEGSGGGAGGHASGGVRSNGFFGGGGGSRDAGEGLYGFGGGSTRKNSEKRWRRVWGKWNAEHWRRRRRPNK